MTLDIFHFAFIDNHCHSLLQNCLHMNEVAFRQAFSETRSQLQLERHAPKSASYMDMLDQLRRTFNVKDEREFLDYRTKQKVNEFTQLLFDEVSMSALIADDGFHSDKLISLNQFSEICRRPVFHCKRIEPVLEELLLREDSFEKTLAVLEDELLRSPYGKVQALKTICGYRGGLSIEFVKEAEAKCDFDKIKDREEAGQRDTQPKSAENRHLRISKGPLYHYLLLRCFEIAANKGLPVQIHTGIGDDDALLLESNPALLQNLFRQKRFANVDFVLLHCYPYVREAAFLCSLYPNVFMDLSLSMSLASPISGQMIYEALSLCPHSKLLAGTDGHSIPEAHWYGARSWKRGLSRALFQLIDSSSITHREAEEMAACILHRNAIELYKLEGLY